MESRCYRMEDLGDLCHLDASDPRLAHARTCPRCRSLLIAVREFHDAQNVPSGARPDEAERTLAAVIAQELERWEPHTASSDVPAQRVAAGGSWRRLAGALWRPVLRPVWGLAAVALVVVLGATVLQPGPSDGDGEPAVRGPAERAVATPELLSVTTSDAGSLLFQWRAVAGADAYEVHVFDPKLNLLLTLPAGADTLLRVPQSQVSGVLPADERRLLWQVIAVRHGDRIAASSPGGFELP